MGEKGKKILAFITAALLGLGAGVYLVAGVLLKERARVPDIVGKDVETATRLLRADGFLLKTFKREYSDNLPKNYVLSQDPPVGKYATKGSEVKVILSKGSEVVMVPDLAGQNLEQAKSTLREVDLTIGQIARVHSSKYLKGYIIAQSPVSGSMVKREDKVNILLSKGPL